MLKKSFTLLVATLFAAAISAQTTYKYGHMNLGNLIEIMPDAIAANATLKVLADKLGAKGDSLATAFEKDYQKLAADYQAGLMTQIAAQKAQEDLEKRQQFLQNYEKEAQAQVAAKRQEVLAPILKKVQDAVDAVAKENKFNLIFDTSSGIALYALETEDITPLVKKKLGIN